MNTTAILTVAGPGVRVAAASWYVVEVSSEGSADKGLLSVHGRGGYMVETGIMTIKLLWLLEIEPRCPEDVAWQQWWSISHLHP